MCFKVLESCNTFNFCSIGWSNLNSFWFIILLFHVSFWYCLVLEQALDCSYLTCIWFRKLKTEFVWGFAILRIMREDLHLSRGLCAWLCILMRNSLSTTAWHSWFVFVSYDLLKILSFLPTYLLRSFSAELVYNHLVCNFCIFAVNYACLIEIVQTYRKFMFSENSFLT